MAKPIEPTPTLYGKDAERLLESMNSSEVDKEKEKFLSECDETFRDLSFK